MRPVVQKESERFQASPSKRRLARVAHPGLSEGPQQGENIIPLKQRLPRTSQFRTVVSFCEALRGSAENLGPAHVETEATITTTLLLPKSASHGIGRTHAAGTCAVSLGPATLGAFSGSSWGPEYLVGQTRLTEEEERNLLTATNSKGLTLFAWASTRS